MDCNRLTNFSEFDNPKGILYQPECGERKTISFACHLNYTLEFYRQYRIESIYNNNIGITKKNSKHEIILVQQISNDFDQNVF